MKILFLCTAHNSLSQVLSVQLAAAGYNVSIEYALSEAMMVEAVNLFNPALVLCPFLTARVPKIIYSTVLTLIVHPGPPGDGGPSSLDWLLMGDDGTESSSTKLLDTLASSGVAPGRTHWGITILQAVEQFDAGPVWAFEQFAVDIDEPGLTKANLYRTQVCSAAATATWSALSRLQNASRNAGYGSPTKFPPSLWPDPEYRELSVTQGLPFLGGKTHHRPLLKAAQREIYPRSQTALQVSRRIRCADSQPGVLSMVFGLSLYIYGGIIEDNPTGRQPIAVTGATSDILGIRHDSEAVCLFTNDGKGVWVTHVRRPKSGGPALWPKVPALSCLLELGLLNVTTLHTLDWPLPCDWARPSHRTFREVWVDIEKDGNSNRTAYLYFEFYNGAMTTHQCLRLLEAMDYIISESTPDRPIHAVAIMGGSYFSNGIALNVIEAAKDAAEESWANINRIDDVVYYLLREFPRHNILTVAGIRGNAAAGGVALATACDVVIAGSHVVLNPAYRAVGLSGSEYHTLTYPARCGKTVADSLVRAMTPLSPLEARRIGLVDYVFPGSSSTELEDHIKSHISLLLAPGCLKAGAWKRHLDMSPTRLAAVRSAELSEMGKDFWSPRAARYHGRRFDFVRKVKPTKTPLRFAVHRRVAVSSNTSSTPTPTNGDDMIPALTCPSGSQPASCDLEETDAFDDVEFFRRSAEQQLKSHLRDQIREEQTATPRRLSIVDLDPVMDRDAAAEPLFACYYRPEDVAKVAAQIEMLTPPVTPLLEPPMWATMMERRGFFAVVEGRC